MEIDEIVVNLKAIRIDGNKLTASIIDQFEISTLYDYIAKRELSDFDCKKVKPLCRVSSLPILKRYRAHLLTTHDKDHVERIMKRFSHVKELGLWSVKSEVFLHPIGARSNYQNDSSWDDLIEEFESLFTNIPKVVYGI